MQEHHLRLEEKIRQALKKVNKTKENELCRYLPVESGGYIHHFTFRKLKEQSPGELVDLIDHYILEVSSPLLVQPKPRAPRMSKNRDGLVLTRQHSERLLQMAILSGDKEMIRVLSQKRSIREIKRDLLKAIRRGEVDETLWQAWKDAVGASQKNPSSDDAYVQEMRAGG